VAALLVAGGASLAAQAAGAVVIVEGQEPVVPIPTLIEATAAQDVADQLFLRLAVPGPTIATGDEKTFKPQLAASWQRRDSVTLAFTLDPRARWHDGQPVTARDVVFSFERARNPTASPTLSRLLTQVSDVRAESERVVVITFARAYREQFYDATFNVQPLPAHLVDTIPPTQLATSGFAQAPVGNGPYKWGRRAPGEFTELTANAEFFLGTPGPPRIIFRVASDPDARLNLLLSGEATALEAIAPPLENRDRVAANAGLRVLAVPSYVLSYLLFNERARGDRTRPHPIFSDPDVRRALVLGLDRAAITQAIWGPYAVVPVGPVPQMSWVRSAGEQAAGRDMKRAQALLATRGWRDTDGDGVLDRDGMKLAFSILTPSSAYTRRQIALLAQQQWKALGVDVTVDIVERPVQAARRAKGDFDVDASSASMDPSPTGLVASWSCAGIGGTNVGSYCNPLVDTLIAAGRLARDNPLPIWRRLAHVIDGDAPAAFIAAPAIVIGLSRQFDDVTITPWSFWSAAWTWRPRAPAAGR
jgi:peptide/nickel transport system substrate-binding protein